MNIKEAWEKVKLHFDTTVLNGVVPPQTFWFVEKDSPGWKICQMQAGRVTKSFSMYSRNGLAEEDTRAMLNILAHELNKQEASK